MTPRRSYGDPCGIARALDLVGERWALLVVRELVLGPKRFTDLRAGLPHVSSEVLAQRLRELESAGVLARRTLRPPNAVRVYELTPWGQELEPVLLALGRFGSQAPMPPDVPALGVDAMVLALPTLFDPEAAGELAATVALVVDEQAFGVRVSDGRLEVTRGDAEPADAAITTDPATLAAVLWHGRRPAEARRAGALRVGGDRRVAERFLRLFPRPPASTTMQARSPRTSAGA